MPLQRSRQARMRVAINLLTEDPENPSGAHWFWTRVIPERAQRLETGEELHLLVSPKSRHLFQGYGTNVFYQAADVFVYPSLNETFGLPILEAMACGCPVVTSDTSAMPETAGGAAVLADPKDPASIAQAIADAIKLGRDGLCDKGLRRAAEFTWGATGAATLDVYRETAGLRRHRRP